jgi:hypothetical protein
MEQSLTGSLEQNNRPFYVYKGLFSLCVLKWFADDDMPPHFLGAPSSSSTAAAEQSYSIHANHFVQFIHKETG